jgi:hypothetical protein
LFILANSGLSGRARRHQESALYRSRPAPNFVRRWHFCATPGVKSFNGATEGVHADAERLNVVAVASNEDSNLVVLASEYYAAKAVEAFTPVGQKFVSLKPFAVQGR